MATIRPAGLEDSAAVLAIRNQPESVFWSGTPPVDQAMHVEWFTRHVGDFLVLVEGTELCGYARLDESGKVSVAVSEKVGGKGYGRQLLDALTDRARHRGRTRLWADIHPSNVASIRAFMHAGYQLDRMVVKRTIFQRVARVLND